MSVKIIHNDIKSNNVVIATNPTSCASTSLEAMYLIDFGKATEKESGHLYTLNVYPK